MAQSVLPKDEKARKAEATRFLSLGLSGAAVAGIIIVTVLWIFERNFAIIPTILAGMTVVLTSLLAFWLARTGKVAFGGYLLTIGFLVEAAVITVMFGGATGPIGIIYVFPILAGGIVIGINYGFLVATLAVALYLLMIPVEQTGLIPQILAPAEKGAIIPFFISIWVIIFYLVAFLSWFAASRLNRALQNVRLYAGELQAANEKLQASEEELRASNEELEASNEELRATEEELRASNEELQTTNDELKEAQEKLVRSEKLAAIGQLAGGVGHELRNPLGAIKNAIYYIKGKMANSELAQKEPRVMEFLGIVDDEINSSTKIISDLLTFSRVGKPAVSRARIEKVIDDAVAHSAIPENIKLTREVADSLPEIQVDTDQIRQVLVNMITNAVQAMPEGGKLAVAARQKDGFMEVEVADTGHGIPQEAINKLFEPLFTTKAKGIGLGLAVCKSIVERHNGHIEVESSADRGTTFTIKLPLKSLNPAQAIAEVKDGKN